MSRVVFLLAPRVHLLDLAGPAQAFSTAADLGLGYTLHYVAEREDVVSTQGVPLRASPRWPALAPADLVVVPGWRPERFSGGPSFGAETLRRAPHAPPPPRPAAPAGADRGAGVTRRVVAGRWGDGWQTGGVTEADRSATRTEPVAGATGAGLVRLRPHRIRVTCWALAAALVALFTVVSTALRGPTGDGSAMFQRGDQAAMIGLGLLGAFLILLFARPRVEADIRGIRVRNVIGSYDLPWAVVRAVRFDRGSAWANLELQDDELVPVLALQAVDRERAVDGVRALRALHTAAAGGGTAIGDGGPVTR